MSPLRTLSRCVALPAVLLSLSPSAAPAEEAPNIVLIVSDDQAYSDFGFMGNDRVRTPNLDALEQL